jgi:large subunit ribosomal protein L10Ae
MQESKDLDIQSVDYEFLRTLNKQKKLIKKWQKGHKVTMATDSLIKRIPAVLGPCLGKIGKFPQIVTHNDNLRVKVDEIRSSVKF